ncbi:MAG: alanine racemase [Clostridia bacterium]|nr:alanine racemase [Clostridia bacterium]
MLPYYLYSSLPELDEHKVWAEINTDHLIYNYKLLCSLTPGTRHICAVKADAYGHVADLCVRVLLEAGCRFFAVSCIEEAISVRSICDSQGCEADVIILGYTDSRQASLLSRHNIIQTVLSEEHAQKLNESAIDQQCRVRTHMALDTGMNRIGICAQSKQECREAAEAIKQISQMKGLTVEGMFTHFARADEELEATIAPDSHTNKQFQRFEQVKKLLEAEGLRLFCHTCNSAAAIRFPRFRLDGVRFGIMLYGISPSEHTEQITKPVMSLHTVISHVHELTPGETVGYGGHFRSDTPRTVATLPIGYADGFLRAYSGAYVTVQTEVGNYKAPVIGRICMDQCMIDVTGLPVKVEDKVTLFCNHSELSALAKMAGTIEYEVLCLISARVPRIRKENRGKL